MEPETTKIYSSGGCVWAGIRVPFFILRRWIDPLRSGLAENGPTRAGKDRQIRKGFGKQAWTVWAICASVHRGGTRLVSLPGIYRAESTRNRRPRTKPEPPQACAGPQYARRDVQVALAPSVSAQLIISPLRYEMPRPPCGRAVRFSGAQEARPQ